MKKLILFISLVFCFSVSFGQVITTNTGGTQGRSGRSVMVEDFNLSARANFTAPRFNDTTQANENVYIISGGQWDTCGRLIYTVDVDGYWVRVCRPSKHWERVGASTILNPNCGLATGTGIVSWDSLLTFDVSAANYALCCDNIPRSTLDTVAILDSNDADFQRIDAIILDSNGVNVVRGEPSENPSTPSTDNCQIVLAYVLINAHDSVPAFLSPTNPGVIYDENTYDTFYEWPIDSLNNMTVDTADTAHPVHGDKDIYVSSYTTGGYMIFTAPQTINLNTYSILKLYVRKTVNTVIRVDFVWYLDGQQVTSQISQSIPATGADFYTTIVIPLINFHIINSDEVNKLRVIITGGGQPLYIDWIQLQGLGAGSTTTIGVESVTISGNNIINPVSNNPNGPNVGLTLPLRNQEPYTVFRQQSSIDSIPVFGKLDLSQNYFTGTLNPVYIQPSDSDGYVLTTIDGSAVWKAVNQDTTWVHNWIRREVSDTSDNDTLSIGSRYPDSSLLDFDTYAGLNGHFFLIQHNGFDWLFLNSNVGDEQSDIQAIDATGNSHLTLNSHTGAYSAELSVSDGSNTVSFLEDAIANKTTITSDSILLNSTLSGASSGYVWTLADPTTGSGYWAVVGGGTFPTLQQVFNTEVGGSLLTKGDTILADNHFLRLMGNTDTLLYVTNTTSVSISAIGAELGVFASGGKGVWGQSTDPSGNYGGTFYTIPTSNNTIVAALHVGRYTSDTLTSAGIGVAIDLSNPQSDLSEVFSNQLISKLIDVTVGASTSQFKITGVLSGSTVDVLTLNSDGSWQIRPITATAASAITPSEGMMLFVSNTNGTFTSIGMWDYENGAWHKM